MLILCCGPDTFRAVARAQELEKAFCQKHDASGSSVEHLESGKNLADEVIERSMSVSLFSPMRFIRADGLAEGCSKTKWKALIHSLTRDSERVIVVSVESQKPDASTMKSLNEIPKLVINEFPILHQAEFRTWLGEAAHALGVVDLNILDRLARACDGDAWLASMELLKIAAGGESVLEHISASDSFGLADAYVRGDRSRFALLGDDASSEGASYPLLQQSLLAVRVASGDSDSVPSYMQSKFRTVSEDQAKKILSATILLSYAQRSGLASDHEALSIIP
ncbi:MAG: hypothetical protein WCK01_01310 [Candidatus Uhrbacteria bacterium]